MCKFAISELLIEYLDITLERTVIFCLSVSDNTDFPLCAGYVLIRWALTNSQSRDLRMRLIDVPKRVYL